jgi:hypothetical protein
MLYITVTTLPLFTRTHKHRVPANVFVPRVMGDPGGFIAVDLGSS